MKPVSITGPQCTTPVGYPVHGIYSEVNGPTATWASKFITSGVFWPEYAESVHSLSDINGKGLNFSYCPNIKEISLERGRVIDLNFSNLPKLEYVFLSSENPGLVGGGQDGDTYNGYLDAVLTTLPDRTSKSRGVVVVRSISSSIDNIGRCPYQPLYLRYKCLEAINNHIAAKNWTVVYDSGVTIYQ